jgi:hypothetical protein
MSDLEVGEIEIYVRILFLPSRSGGTELKTKPDPALAT